MEQLIYISTARALQPGAALVQEVLQVSRRNNHRDGLTGLLVVGGRRFLQVLEGPRQTLNAAFRRIKADERHFAVVELTRKPISSRSFPDWDMAYQESGTVGDEFADLSGIVSALTEQINDPDLKAQLRGFAELHARAA